MHVPNELEFLILPHFFSSWLKIVEHAVDPGIEERTRTESPCPWQHTMQVNRSLTNF